MVLYLIEENYLSKCIYNNHVESIHSFNTCISDFEEKYLIDIHASEKVIKRVLSVKSKLPIYFGTNLLLLKVSLGEVKYMINYFAILTINYKYDDVEIRFNNGDKLSLLGGKNQFKRQVETAEKIIEIKRKAQINI